MEGNTGVEGGGNSSVKQIFLLDHCVLCWTRTSSRFGGEGSGGLSKRARTNIVPEAEFPAKCGFGLLGTLNWTWNVLRRKRRHGGNGDEKEHVFRVSGEEAFTNPNLNNVTKFNSIPKMCQGCGDKLLEMDKLLNQVVEEIATLRNFIGRYNACGNSDVHFRDLLYNSPGLRELIEVNKRGVQDTLEFLEEFRTRAVGASGERHGIKTEISSESMDHENDNCVLTDAQCEAQITADSECIPENEDIEPFQVSVPGGCQFDVIEERERPSYVKIYNPKTRKDSFVCLLDKCGNHFQIGILLQRHQQNHHPTTLGKSRKGGNAAIVIVQEEEGTSRKLTVKTRSSMYPVPGSSFIEPKRLGLLHSVPAFLPPIAEQRQTQGSCPSIESCPGGGTKSQGIGNDEEEGELLKNSDNEDNFHGGRKVNQDLMILPTVPVKIEQETSAAVEVNHLNDNFNASDDEQDPLFFPSESSGSETGSEEDEDFIPTTASKGLSKKTPTSIEEHGQVLKKASDS